MTDKIEALSLMVLALAFFACLNFAMMIALGNRLCGLISYCEKLRQYTAQIAEHVNYTNDDDDDPDDGEPMPIADDKIVIVQFDRKRA
jgi:hypothetical protein